ncbi:MAG: hypothetical protein J1F40_00780 [Prevotellaceae bacterium]|nr:hypothetical protein [Prevotellaceae bacterium]
MRKIYSLIAFAAMSLLSLTASAIDYNIPEENAVLQNDTYHCRIYKNVNLVGLELNGEPIEGGLTFDTSITTSEFQFNGYKPWRCTTEGLTFLWLSVGNIGWEANYGIRNTGSGPRGFHIASLKKGQILVLQGTNAGYNTGETNTEYNGFCVPNGSRYNANTGWLWEYTDPLIVEDISDEIHAAQDAIGGGEDDSEVTRDNFMYLRVIEDGVLNLPIERSASLQGFQIWLDATAPETISAPSFSVVGVNGADREILFKSGESTLGYDVKTYFSTDGTDPIFLKEGDEFDYWEYVYDENDNSVAVDSIAHYKKVLDMDIINGVAHGSYGERPAPVDEAVPLYESEDLDGDGIVEVKAATVNEQTGVFSEITTVKISVGEIQLNAPTLTLYGFDGTYRKYAIGWVNNTLCGEEYSFTVEADGNMIADEYTIGSIIEIEDDVTVTVYADGYLENEVSTTADYQGIDIHRKYEDKDADGNPIHDWDFTSLTEEQKAIVKGQIIEGYYTFTESGDSVYCTKAEYDASPDGFVNGVDFAEATTVYAPSCWWWDASNQRATLNVDTLGNNANANNMGYVEDKANIFPDMLINCPPNASNSSTIFIYIDRANGTHGNLGAYFMARPEFTFSRSRAVAGEFVIMTVGTGGSNWTNEPYPIVKQVPEDALLTVNGLPSNGFHVFYIDVYTYDGLPEDLLGDANDAWEDAVAIEGVTASGKAISAIYNVSGAKLSAPQKGINIVKYTDGTSAKILVK